MANDDPLTTLEAEYCPPLDSALLSAILSDYDLSSSSAADLTSARATLDALKESALLEEAAGFDPSGTGGEDAEIWDETGASRSRETDATSVSNGAEEESGGGGSAEDLEALSEDAKVALLREMFGERLGAYHVLHTFRKCGGRWEGAVEELLNHVYFGEVGDGGLEGEGVKAKGVEGFSEDNIVRRGRKTKAKGQKLRAMEERRAASVPVSSAEGEGQTGNKWLTAKEDVDFVASRTGIEILTVKSTYNEHGANVPKTINALLKQTMEETKKVVTDDALVQSHARDLGAAFPSLAPHYLTALIRLTHPSTSSAHDLAAALVAKPPPQAGLQVIPIYARPTPSDLNPDTTEPTSPRAPRSANPSLARAPDDPTVALRGRSYAAARAQAFAQASAAHRRAGSDRLMGGAAAYYSQLGRELTALSAGATADAADALAERQSGAAVLDLHGIDVLNGVRIAVERVEGWWEGLGERRVNRRGGAEERGEGFRVVVGAGRHSEGGKGKLGPAVTKALRERGWRVEGAGAVLIVKGKVRR